MRRKSISETERKAIVRAMAAARKLGYFAKYNFKACRNSAQDALSEQGIQDQYIYSINDRCDNQIVNFYWAGNGESLANLFRTEGLTVDWDGTRFMSIIVKLQPAT